MLPLRIGAFTPDAPVVLAPMAGVTNRAFRAMCRGYGPDLVYVNEMVMATAVVHRNDKTLRMMSFGPDEAPRSLQLYGSDPADARPGGARGVRRRSRRPHRPQLRLPGRQGHPQGWRGCGAGPAQLLRAIVRAAVGAATPYGVPVTAKFRMGLWDDLRTDVSTGQICADGGRRLDRPARPHGAAALLGRCPLGRDRRTEAGRARHPGARQRRHLGGRRRGRDDGARPAATAW